MHRQRPPPRPKRRGAETAVPPSPQLPTPVVTLLTTSTRVAAATFQSTARGSRQVRPPEIFKVPSPEQ
ncbi:hypothetical protein MTO96_034890 [Rhipicephalus appendiculatus]